MKLLTISLIFVIPFSIIMWLSIFSNTIHRLKDYKKDRIKLGILNATITTLSMATIIIISLIFILRKLNL